MHTLGWASDGWFAGLALAAYGLLLLWLVLMRTAKRDPAVMRFVRLGLAWHLATYLFVVLWLMPYYADLDEADAYVYHHEAMKYASMIRSGDWDSIPLHVGTETTSLLTALLYTPFGGNMGPPSFPRFSGSSRRCSSAGRCTPGARGRNCASTAASPFSCHPSQCGQVSSGKIAGLRWGWASALMAFRAP